MVSKFSVLAAFLVSIGIHVAWADQVIPINEVFSPSQSYDPAKYARVAVVQWNPIESTPVGVTVGQAEAFMARNRATLGAKIREAAATGAELVITSEFGVDGYPDIPGLPPEEDDYRNRADIAPYVEPIPGTTSDYFSALAKELGIYIHVGFAEVDPTTGRYYNTVIALDSKGNIVAKYHKINLYELENNFLSAGTAAVAYDSPFGRIGLIICADVTAANPIDVLMQDHVDVLALSTSWAQMNTGWDAFTSAAIKTHAYLLAANQNYFPDSGVLNPDGTSQSHIRQTAGTAYGYLPRVQQSLH
jgi:predicted amidohydrolase